MSSVIPRRNFIATSLAALGAARVEVGAETKGKKRKGKIKIGQIGTAHAHAGGKMSTMRKFSEDYEVVGCVEPDEGRRQAAEKSKTYQGVRWLTEEQLLNTAGLQAVAVETAVEDLVPTAARCVAAGKHIHLDKPAGDSLSAFKAVLDNATRQKLTVQMGYMLRYNPGIQFVFETLRRGWLGDIFEVHTVMSKAVGASTRQHLARFKGGTMFELGCHIIDATVAVLGNPEKVTPFIRNTKPDQDTLADNMLAVLEYPRATATVRSALVEVDGFRRRQFVVCGDHGTIDIRPLEPPKLLFALDRAREGFRRGYQEVELPRLGGRYDGDFIDLAAIIRGEKESDYPPSHDLAVQRAVLEASGMPLN